MKNRSRIKREAKLKEKHIQEIEEEIKRWDRFILNIYYRRILCDKFEIGLSEKYYDFIRNMPQEFYYLRDMLVNVVYPKIPKKGT